MDRHRKGYVLTTEPGRVDIDRVHAWLAQELGCSVSIKLETANPGRSFRGRGTEVVASRLAGEGSRSVVCASAGNLGHALAWSGRARGDGPHRSGVALRTCETWSGSR